MESKKQTEARGDNSLRPLSEQPSSLEGARLLHGPSPAPSPGPAPRTSSPVPATDKTLRLLFILSA